MNRAFCVHCLRFVSLCVFASTSEQNRPKLCLAQLVAVLICTIHSCVYRAPVRDPLPHLQPSPPITHTKEGIVNTLQAATSGLSESVRGRQGTVVSALGPLYHTHTQTTTTTKNNNNKTTKNDYHHHHYYYHNHHHYQNNSSSHCLKRSVLQN